MAAITPFFLTRRFTRSIAARVLERGLVATAVGHARQAGCEWIEVDFDDAERLAPFYFDACGFRPTNAGLIHLPDR